MWLGAWIPKKVLNAEYNGECHCLPRQRDGRKSCRRVAVEDCAGCIVVVTSGPQQHPVAERRPPIDSQEQQDELHR